MLTVPEFLKAIRKEQGLTQQQLADSLGVSKILVSMVETGQKSPSKTLVTNLARALKVHPASIMPFLADNQIKYSGRLSILESSLLKIAKELQLKLIKRRSNLLKPH